MNAHKFLLATLVVLILLSGCGSPPLTPTSPQPLTPTTLTIVPNFTGTDVSDVTIETISQPNCGGTAEVETKVEKSRSIQHIIELQNGMSVNANGQLGFAGTDVELGATIASQLGDSYGTVDNISRSLTVKASKGTNMQHVIRLVEIWQVGTATISVGGQQITVPFRYRHDFDIELVDSKDLGGCNTLTPPSSPSASEVVATPTQSIVSCAETGGTELLSAPWHLRGQNGDSQMYQEINPGALKDKSTISVTYNLHGLQVHEGERKDESAIIFDQPNWFVVSLANYGQNGLDGEQTVYIPLSDFIGLPDPSGIAGGGHLNLDAPVGTLHTRFWSSQNFTVDITSVCAQ